MSDEREDGGPAFPCPMGPEWPECDRGMELRDYFAGQAIVGLLAEGRRMEVERKMSGKTKGDPHGVFTAAANYAYEAYLLADAMIAARKGTPNE